MFKDGKYRHENGFIVTIIDGEIYMSPNHPLSLRLSDIFDMSKWEEIENDT